MTKLLWTNRSNFGPTPRTASAACYDSTRNRTVLFGGDAHLREGDGRLGDTWEWDGAFWTQVEDIGPAARLVASMVYDSVRKVSLLFGGRGSLPLGDTWQWDGDTWTKLAESGPTARSSTGMAFDSARGVTVLFGGQSHDDLHLGDTWEFDGDKWTQVQDVGPPPRGAHSMAFDNGSKRVVLFGGVGVSNQGLGDTWAWDGQEWVQLAEFGPPPRLNAGMVSASAGGLLLFGGVDSLVAQPAPQTLGDTWEFDGKRWTQLQDIGPGPLQNAAMVFDSAQSRVVMFGGLVPGAPGNFDTVSNLTWTAGFSSNGTPGTLKALAIVAPASAKRFSPITLTFQLNQPAPAGGAVVSVDKELLDLVGSDLLKVQFPGGASSVDVGASFRTLGTVTLHAGIQSTDEASVTVDVT